MFPNARGPLSLTVALGALGAVLLVLSAVFFTPGKFILIPYAALVLGVALVLRTSALESYSQRFMVGFGAFLLASIALYIAILVSPYSSSGINILGHLWRFAMVAGIGAAISAAVARVTQPA